MATVTMDELMTIGEVRRRLAVLGVGRSETIIRRLEARGVVTPIRVIGQDRRLFTSADVQKLEAAIRGTMAASAA